jgi:ATP-dependent DNA helicase RecG
MLKESGLTAANVLQRAGRRLGFLTVRELLFHLPRRYDDLREMRQLGELGWVEEGTVVSARVTSPDVRVEPSFRRRIQRTIAVLEDPTGSSRRRGSVAATSSGGCSRRRDHRLGQAQAVRPEADDRQSGLPAVGRDDELLHVGRIVPGLPADRRIDGRSGSGSRCARRSTGRATPTGVPARRIRDERGLVGIAGALEEAHYPRRSRAATRPSGGSPSTSCSRSSSGMVGRRRQRGRDAARADRRRRRDATRRCARRWRLDPAQARRERRPDRRPGRGDRRDPRDLGPPTPMLRLLQGDVGSGKTAVAAWALGAARSPAGRARCSPRRICSPASTTRRWRACSRAPASRSSC